jgi:hypothetical protein
MTILPLNNSNPSYVNMPPVLFPVKLHEVNGIGQSSVKHAWIGMDPLEMISMLAKIAEQREFRASGGKKTSDIRYGTTKLSSNTLALPQILQWHASEAVPGRKTPSQAVPSNPNVAIIPEDSSSFSEDESTSSFFSVMDDESPRSPLVVAIKPKRGKELRKISHLKKAYTESSVAKESILVELSSSRPRRGAAASVAGCRQGYAAIPGVPSLNMWQDGWLCEKDVHGQAYMRTILALAQKHQAFSVSVRIHPSYCIICKQFIHELNRVRRSLSLGSGCFRVEADRIYKETISKLEALNTAIAKVDVSDNEDFADYMFGWLQQNWIYPFPDEDEMQRLGNACGVPPKQINNWLINARTRKWRPSILKAFSLNRPLGMLEDDSLLFSEGKKAVPFPLRSFDTTEEPGIETTDVPGTSIEPVAKKPKFSEKN